MNRKLIIISCVAIIVILPLFIYFVNARNQKRAAAGVAEQTGDARDAVAAEIPADKANDVARSDIRLIGDAYSSSFVASDSNAQRQSVVLKNDVYTIAFDSKGASVSSIVLNEYKEKGSDLEILYKTDPDKRAFLLYRGGDLNSPIDDVFEVESRTADTVVFRRDYILNGKPVTLRKAFAISNQYMLRINVSLTGLSTSDLAGLTSNAYSLEFAPYLGPAPSGSKKGSSADARNFYIKKDKKRRGINFAGSSKNVFVYKDGFDWFEWTGKYFSVIMIPESREAFDVSAYKRGAYDNSVILSRNNDFIPSPDGSVELSDSVYSYIGPQLKDKLQLFDYKEDNDFKLSGLSLSKAMEGGGALPWLQNILKFIMKIFYGWIPNWGVSIIFLTLFIKILLYPLNARSARSAAAMQKVAPRLEEIRKEFKDDPQKQNQAIMSLYKKNNISPLSSMLPMLIQLPILFAVYGLLNKHFELRGAMFIPGWIEDLSVPDTVYELSFSIPFLGNQVHILPIIYGLSMVFSMVWTQKQNTAGQTKGFQKFMIYGLPIILFFSLYNVSSGLLVYWTVMNVFSILQQMYENSKLKASAAAENAAADSNGGKGGLNVKVLPPKAKKNKKNRR
ncbi:MAG TPA: membrane protein insertase YidC [Spirochaetaceae bacterium]|nr:membrane protein insertase YidC [Spirochaetaceae bacterium]